MDRNYLAGPQGDAINAVLAAAGYNFRLLLNWLRLLLCLIASLMLIRSHAAVRLQIA
jgi:transposase, IS5 family